MPGSNIQAAWQGLRYQEYVTLYKLLRAYEKKQDFSLEVESDDQGMWDDLTVIKDKKVKCYQIKYSSKAEKVYELKDFENEQSSLYIQKLFDSWRKIKEKYPSFKRKIILYTCKGLKITDKILAHNEASRGKCVQFQYDSLEKYDCLINLIKKEGKSDTNIREFFDNFYIHYKRFSHKKIEESIKATLKRLRQLSTKPMIDALYQFMRDCVLKLKKESSAISREKVEELLEKANFTSQTFERLRAITEHYYAKQIKGMIGNNKYEIPREGILKELEGAIAQEHCLLIGYHGIGKSALIKKLIERRDTNDYLMFDAKTFSLKDLGDSRDRQEQAISYIAEHINLIIIENCEGLPFLQEQLSKLHEFIQMALSIASTKGIIKFLLVTANEAFKKAFNKEKEHKATANFISKLKKIEVPYLTLDEIKKYLPEFTDLLQRLPNNTLFLTPFTLNLIVNNRLTTLENLTINDLIEFQLKAGSENKIYKKKKNILCDLVLGKTLVDTPELESLKEQGIISQIETQGIVQYDAHTLYKEWAMNRILNTYYKFYVERSFKPDNDGLLNKMAEKLTSEWRCYIGQWIVKEDLFRNLFAYVTVNQLSESAKYLLLSVLENCDTDKEVELVRLIIKNPKTDIIDLMLASIKASYFSKFALLHAAIDERNVDIAQYILTHCRWNCLHECNSKSEGYCAINYAIINKQNKILRMILKAEKEHYGNDTDINVSDGWHDNSLEAAIDAKNITAIRILLRDERIDLTMDVYNCPIMPFGKALHVAVVCLTESEKDLDILKQLLARGANPGIQNNDGVTPMHLAVWLNKPKVLELLLKYSDEKNILLKVIRSNGCLSEGDTLRTIADKCKAKKDYQYNEIVKLLEPFFWFPLTEKEVLEYFELPKSFFKKLRKDDEESNKERTENSKRKWASTCSAALPEKRAKVEDSLQKKSSSASKNKIFRLKNFTMFKTQAEEKTSNLMKKEKTIKKGYQDELYVTLRKR